VKWDTRKPCGSCPYRKDAPLRLWHPSEFENLLENDEDTLRGHLFACHATKKAPEQSVCAGWLLDQDRRGLPSIQLRLVLNRSAEARQALEQVSDGGHRLYGSILEMVAANYPECDDEERSFAREYQGLWPPVELPEVGQIWRRKNQHTEHKVVEVTAALVILRRTDAKSRPAVEWDLDTILREWELVIG